MATQNLYIEPVGPCQVCMESSEPMKRMLEPCGYKEDKQNYIQLFYDCFNLEVGLFTPEEHAVICLPCVEKLNDAWLLWNLVKQTQEKLRDCKFQEVVTKQESTPEYLLENIIVEDSIEIFIKSEPAQKPRIQQTKKEKNLEKIKYGSLERRSYGIGKDSRDCKVCNSSFKTHTLLMQHMTEHYPNYVCFQCGKKFLTKRQLNAHNKVHRLRLVCCEICKKELRKVYLRLHMRDVHNVNSTVYQCNDCDRNFIRKISLMSHIDRVHQKTINVYCSICNRGFHANKDLKRHMLKHSGIRRFPCLVCEKAFLKKDTLTAHMKIHSNRKDFVCSLCRKEFTYKCSLKGHMHTHHPDVQI